MEYLKYNNLLYLFNEKIPRMAIKSNIFTTP
jgi:hypothetical protein